MLFLCALPVVFYPTDRAWAGWSAAVYQGVQRSAAAARSDVFDPTAFPDNDDARRDDVVRTLALLKQRRLAMFADSAWELMGTQWQVTEPAGEITLDVRVVDTFTDALNGLPAARVEGVIAEGIANVPHPGQLAILDQDDRVAGLLEFSFIRPDAKALRLDIPRKHGFDGYIRNYHADQNYRLIVLQADTKRVLLLKQLDPR